MYFDNVVVASIAIIIAILGVSGFGISFLMSNIAADAARLEQDK